MTEPSGNVLVPPDEPFVPDEAPPDDAPLDDATPDDAPLDDATPDEELVPEDDPVTDAPDPPFPLLWEEEHDKTALAAARPPVNIVVANLL